MAKTIDLSQKLDNSRPFIKVAEGKIYEVDNRKNTVLRFDQLMRNGDPNDTRVLGEMVSTFLGKNAAKEIEAMDLTMPSYIALIIGIVAAATDEDFEVAEARFHKEGGLLGG